MVEVINSDLVEATIAARFYPDVTAGPAALVWAGWHRPSHAELVQAWPHELCLARKGGAHGW